MIFKKDKMKELRIKMGWSQEHLAQNMAIAGFRVSRSSIDSWETGRRLPKLNAISKIAEQFKKPVTFFLGN